MTTKRIRPHLCTAAPPVARAPDPPQAAAAAGHRADPADGRRDRAVSRGHQPRLRHVHRPRPAHPVSDPGPGRGRHRRQGAGAVFPERPGPADRAAGDPRTAGPHVRPPDPRRPGAHGARGAGPARRPFHHRCRDHPRGADPRGQRRRRRDHRGRPGRQHDLPELAAVADRRRDVSAGDPADRAHRPARPPSLGRHAGARGRDRRPAERKLRPGPHRPRLPPGGRRNPPRRGRLRPALQIPAADDQKPLPRRTGAGGPGRRRGRRA